MLEVVAARGNTVMITDREDGPGVILWMDGMSPRVIHKDSALAFGYWTSRSGPVPRLSAQTITELMMFNQNWARAFESMSL